MNVLVAADLHFVKVGDQYYSKECVPNFFQRYLEVWDQVIVLGRLAELSSPPQGAAPLDFRNVTFVRGPDFHGPFQYLQRRGQVQRAAQRALAMADSVLFRGCNTLVMPLYHKCRRAKRPYGIEVLGCPYDTFAPGANSHLLRPLFRWLATREQLHVCRDAYAATYVTEHVLQQRYPPGSGRFATSYSDVVIPPECFLATSRKPRPVQDRKHLVTVGTMSVMYKAYDVLIPAVAKAVESGIDLDLTIIGDGKHQAELQELTSRLNIADRVIFRGRVTPGPPIFAELDQADLFVLASRQEGLPRALVEAMARGLPSIGSTVGGFPELLSPEDLVPPNDVDALAKKIIEVIRDPARLSEMSARNLQRSMAYNESTLHARRFEFYQYLRRGTESWLKGKR
jgi:glycosyltransferase involved in cell wall biosynthesis